MCISFIYINNDAASDEDFHLIIAGNRDEFYNRPTLPAHFWNGHCISGLDAQQSREGGTWFGMSIKYRRIGTLLNILTSGLSPDKKPRGQLVVDYLVTNADTQTYLNGIAQERQLYNSFNLVLLENINDTWSAFYCSSDDEKSPRKLPDGVLAFGNSVIDRPWQKVTRGKERFGHIVKTYGSLSSVETLEKELFELMADRTRHLPDPVLENTLKDHPAQKYVAGRSAIFVDLMPSVAYGTRTTTLVFVDSKGNCTYTEKTMKQCTGVDGDLTCDPANWETSNYHFVLNDRPSSANQEPDELAML